MNHLFFISCVVNIILLYLNLKWKKLLNDYYNALVKLESDLKEFYEKGVDELIEKRIKEIKK